MLRLPAEDALPGPLMIPREEEHEEEDLLAEAPLAAENDSSGTLRLLFAVTVPALLALAVFAWWLMPKNGGEDQAPGPADPAATAKNEEPAAPTAMGVTMEVDSVARNFLEAKSVEEMLRWVRLPEQTKPKVEKWLAGAAYKAPGLQTMAGEYRYSAEKGREIFTVPVRTGDFEQRDLMLVREPAGLRADWEAWVAWSEMSLKQFRKEKPQEPKAFRVVVSESDYFNFHFKNEVEWSSYRIDSLDGEESIFGYAPRGTDMNSHLDLMISKGTTKMLLLRLKFPAEGRADNQAEIVEVVSDSWVDTSTAPPPP